MSPLNPMAKRAAGEVGVTIGAMLVSAVGALFGLVVGGIVAFPIALVWSFIKTDPDPAKSLSLDTAFSNLVGPCAFIGAALGFLILGGWVVIGQIGRLLIGTTRQMNRTVNGRQSVLGAAEAAEQEGHSALQQQVDRHNERLALRDDEADDVRRRLGE